MPQTVRGVIARVKGAPVEIVDVVVPDPGPGEAVVQVQACGVCHTDLHYREGCFNTHNARQKMTLTDGTELSPALGIGAFVEKTLVASGQCTKVDPEAAPTAAGLLGCGVLAGFGAAVNTGGVTRGDSVAVIGCGGVGNAAIAAARLAGATTIVAVHAADPKLEWAKRFGATHTVN